MKRASPLSSSAPFTLWMDWRSIRRSVIRTRCHLALLRLERGTFA